MLNEIISTDNVLTIEYLEINNIIYINHPNI